MATFRVGQRVRIKCPGSSVNGAETTVRRPHVELTSPHGLRISASVEVNIRCALGAIMRQCAGYEGWCVFSPHELEPIVDDGRQVVSWAECAWQPPKVLA